jgi:hypothetical protein
VKTPAARRASCRGALALMFVSACGGHTTVVPTRAPGGTVQGDYVLRVEPAASCGAPTSSLSFPVTAYAADTDRFPGIQIVPRGQASLLPPASRLGDKEQVIEVELQYVSPDVRGGLGTATYGAAAQEGFYLFVHAMATGSVSHLTGEPGEITEGTLAGELEFGRNATDPGGLGACASEAHHWSLKRT